MARKPKCYTVVGAMNANEFRIESVPSIAAIEAVLDGWRVHLDTVLVFAGRPLSLKRTLAICADNPERKPRTRKVPAAPAGKSIKIKDENGKPLAVEGE